MTHMITKYSNLGSKQEVVTKGLKTLQEKN